MGERFFLPKRRRFTSTLFVPFILLFHTFTYLCFLFPWVFSVHACVAVVVVVVVVVE